jgi:hypothetical protein
MKNKALYTIYDIKAQVHNNPMVQNNNNEALRTFAQLANDTTTTVNKHPEDYQLCKVGEWDEYTGEIIGNKKLDMLGTALDFIAIGQIEEN